MTAARPKNFLMHGMRTANLATELIIGVGLRGNLNGRGVGGFWL
jgi:hypothetical protein